MTIARGIVTSDEHNPDAAASQAAGRWLLRHYVELLTGATVLLIAQMGLVPFDWGTGEGTGPTAMLFGRLINNLTFPDIVSNIFLYVPVGALFHWSIRRAAARRGRHVPALAALLFAVVLAAGLSASIEWLQAYSPSRVSSIIDLVSNVTGALVGATVAGLVQRLIPPLIGTFIIELRTQPRTAVTKAYCLLLVLFAAIPFSFSFDVARLKQAARSAVLVPFQADTRDREHASAALAETDYQAYAHAEWARLKRYARWTAECVSFVVLAQLLLLMARRDYGFTPRAAVFLTLWIGGGLAILLSILQFPLVSRACDVTDILVRWAGLGIGAIARVAWHHGGQAHQPQDATHRARFARTACIGAAGYILYTGLIPLTIDARAAGPSTAMREPEFLPFFAYFMTRFDLMMADVMEKFAAYFLLAGALSLTWTMGEVPLRRKIVAAVALSLALAVPIEFVQVYIPVRVPSLTDPILAAAACIAGALACEKIGEFHRTAVALEVPAVPATGVVHRPLSPTDELIATLTQPSEDAPTETVPQPSPRPRR